MRTWTKVVADSNTPCQNLLRAVYVCEQTGEETGQVSLPCFRKILLTSQAKLGRNSSTYVEEDLVLVRSCFDVLSKCREGRESLAMQSGEGVARSLSGGAQSKVLRKRLRRKFAAGKEMLCSAHCIQHCS